MCDYGWVLGHSCLVYGSLIRSCTSIIFEGKPVIPDAGVLWRIIQKYKIDHLFFSPTAAREILKLDHYGKFIKECDVSSVKII